MAEKSVPKGQPWYRYSYVWILLIAAPLLTLVGSIATIYIAVSSSESTVHESYIKQGISPNELAPREEKAKEKQLFAHLTVKADTVVIIFNQAIADNKLLITFQHPTLSQFDFHLPLIRSAENTQTFSVIKPKNLRQNKWDIFVDSSTDEWRIKGRLLTRENEIELTPFGQ